MPEDHRREGAVELDADAVAEDQPAGHRIEAPRLLRGQLLVEARSAPHRLEAQQLQLVEAQLADQPRDFGHLVERAAADHAVHAHLGLHGAQEPQCALGVPEPVESARLRIRRAHTVDADVDLAEHAALFRCSGVEAQSAGGQVGRDSARSRVGGDGEEIVELERLAAPQCDVEHAHFGQLVEDAAGLVERKGGALRRGIDVAAAAAGRAPPRENDVHFRRRAERPRRQIPERRVRMAQLAHHLPVDLQQRAGTLQLDDPAEALGTRPRHLHCALSLRRSAPSTTARALAKIDPKSRKVTSTPSELELGLQPKVACRTRPRRKGLMAPCYFVWPPPCAWGPEPLLPDGAGALRAGPLAGARASPPPRAREPGP